MPFWENCVPTSCLWLGQVSFDAIFEWTMLCRPFYGRIYVYITEKHSQARISCLSFDFHVLRVVEWFQRGFFVTISAPHIHSCERPVRLKTKQRILRNWKCACVKYPIEAIIHTFLCVLCPFVCVFRLSVALCAPRFACVPHTTYSLTYEARWLQ